MNRIGTLRKNIPTDIVHDILLRLPVKSLLRFRYLSKMCCKTIDKVSFAIMHELTCVEESQILYTFCDLTRVKKVHSITYDEGNNVMKKSEIPILEIPEENRKKYSYKLCFVAYGLLCFRDCRQHKHEVVFLLNPQRGEVLELPRPTSKLWMITEFRMSWYGMGFDCTTNTYKIIRMIAISFPKFETEIHTLGTDSWRRIDSSPSCIRIESNPSFILTVYGVDAYGDMHWVRFNLKQGREYEAMIISFDFKKEEFKWTRHPNLEYNGCRFSYMKFRLINMRGSLAIVHVIPSDNQMEIWVMKDYYKKEYYWVREFRLSDGNISPYNIRSWRNVSSALRDVYAWGDQGLYVSTISYRTEHYVIDLKTNHMGYIIKRFPLWHDVNDTDSLRVVYTYTSSVVCLRNFGNPVADHSDNFIKIARFIYVSPR